MFKFFRSETFKNNIVPVVGYVGTVTAMIGAVAQHELVLRTKENTYEQQGLKTERIRLPFDIYVKFLPIIIHYPVDVGVVDEPKAQTSPSAPR